MGFAGECMVGRAGKGRRNVRERKGHRQEVIGERTRTRERTVSTRGSVSCVSPGLGTEKAKRDGMHRGRTSRTDRRRKKAYRECNGNARETFGEKYEKHTANT